MRIIIITVLLFSLSFNVIGQSLPKPCKKITRELDDFSGEIRLSTPYGWNMPVITKVIDGDAERIYLMLYANGSTLNVGEEGVTILLDNGGRISRPKTKIDVDAQDIGWRYSAILSLTDDEIDILSNTTINKFQLYIYEMTIHKKGKTNLMTQMGCLSDMK
jgi:hypothetical protein